MIDDATVYRLGQDNFRFVGGDEYDGIWLNELRRAARAQGVGQAVDRPAPQRRRPGPESRELLKKIVWTPPTQTSLEDLKWFRFTVGRIGTYDGIPIVVSRTGYTGELGLRGLVPPLGRPGGLGRDLGGGRGARPHAARPRSARHPAHRVGPDLRGLRVRRPGRPVRGGHRLRGRPADGRRLRRPRGARGAPGAPAAHARRARARGQRDRRPRRRDLRRAASGSASSRAARAARS